MGGADKGPFLGAFSVHPGGFTKNLFSDPAVTFTGFGMYVIIALLVIFFFWGMIATAVGFQGGNFATAGNSPLWEGGSLSDQANLAVSSAYANHALAGQTNWIPTGSCPPGASAGAARDAVMGASLGSMSDAALLRKAM